MEGTRRAELLISRLRWPLFVTAALLLDDPPGLLLSAALVAFCVGYNLAVTYTLQTRERFIRFGFRVAFAARAIDMALITVVAAVFQGTSGQCYLLYLFVLVSAGYTSTRLRTLALTTVSVLAANAAASYYAAATASNIAHLSSHLTTQTLALLAGSLAAVYLAKGRSHDEHAAHQGFRLRALFDCAGRLTETRDVNAMAQHVLESAVQQTGAQGGQLLLVAAKGEDLQSEAIADWDPLPEEQQAAVKAAMAGAVRWVRASGREILIQPGQQPLEEGESRGYAYSIIATPLLWSDNSGSEREVLGVIVLWNHAETTFTHDELELLQALSALAAVGIVNLRLYTNLQNSFFRTLGSLAKSLEARDDYTQGHSDRVTKVACMLAEHMSVPKEGVELLRYAGPLHDIGKVGVPDAILRKNGKLTAEEWEIMRRHPIISEEICRPLGLPEEVLFLVLHHHERLDGKGYPEGLRAEDLPLILRILTLADCFDALRSRRPYREPMTREELVAEFNKCAGRMLDPSVVEAWKQLLETGELDQIYSQMDAEIGIASKPEYSLAA